MYTVVPSVKCVPIFERNKVSSVAFWQHGPNCLPIFSLNLNALILAKCSVDRCVVEALVKRRLGPRGTLGARRNGDLGEVAPISKLCLLPSLLQDHWFGFRNLKKWGQIFCCFPFPVTQEKGNTTSIPGKGDICSGSSRLKVYSSCSK